MNWCKKGIALSLAAFMAANLSVPVSAAEKTSGKEEVIYVMTQADGTVDNVNAVNIFPGGDVTDYGDYSSVKMLTTTDKIHQKKDKITFSSSADKVYYQGTLKNAEVPWDISIRYFLNDEEYSAEEIAGKSGALEIKVSITENPKCKNSFFDKYALQAAFLLDTNLCTNIKADGATEANVGADKQLSYTVLPGKGLETSIYADVENFEMDAVSINGVKLDLNMDIDKDELTDKTEELMKAVKTLNQGTTQIYDGAKKLKNGGGTLNLGISAFHSGVGKLDSGILTLQKGMKSMEKGVNTLNSKSSDLKKGSGQIEEGIESAAKGAKSLQDNLGYAQYKGAMAKNGLNVDDLKNKNQQAVSNCSAQIESLKKTISVLESQQGQEKQIEQLQSQISYMENMMQLLKANSAAMGGTESYLNSVSSGAKKLSSGTSALETAYDKFNRGLTGYTNGVSSVSSGYHQMTDGVSSLASGSKELLKNSGKLSSGSSELYDGIVDLCGGAQKLNSGTGELDQKTSNMDTKLQDKIDDILSSIQGDETKPQSFVSKKNKNVESVQFVIKTSAIEKKEKKAVKKETKETQSLWDKVTQLFGL